MLEQHEYYRTDNGVLYKGDCVELIKYLPDNIGLTLSDPPFGDDISYGRMQKEIANNENPSINKVFLAGIHPKMKQNSCTYVYTNWKFYPLVKLWGEDVGFKTKMLICIVKNNIGMGQAFRNQHEFCIVFEKGEGVYNKLDFSNVQFMNHIPHSQYSHPHEKCIHMLSRVLEHSSNSDDIVFDGFGGVGSVAVACERLHRRWISVELNEKYCEMAKRRIQEENNQLKLFP